MKKIKKNVAFLLALLTCGLFCVAVPFPAGGAEEKVVYLSDEGSDAADGLSAKMAKKTLAAAGKLLGDGGLLVVCGPVTLDGTSASGLTFPKSTGTVTVTSFAKGVDYRVTAGARLTVKGSVYLGGATVFQSLEIRGESSPRLYGRGHDLIFERDLNVTGTAPTIFGGTYGGAVSSAAASTFSGYSIMVRGGKWGGVYGGNYRDSGSQPCGTVGNVSITVSGATVTGTSTLGAVAGATFCGLDGDVSIRIKEGAVIQNGIYAVSRKGNNATQNQPVYDGSAEIVLSGGRLTSAPIAAVKEPDSGSLLGDFSLTVLSGASLDAKCTPLSAEGVLGRADASVPTADLAGRLRFFPPVYYLSAAGGKGNNGLIASSPITFDEVLKKISPEEDRAVLCLTDAVEMDLSRLPAVGEMTLSCINGGSLVLKGNQSLPCALVLDTEIKAENAVLSMNGRSLTATDRTSVTGSLSVDGGESEEGHVICLYAGTYESVKGGRSQSGTVAVALLKKKIDSTLLQTSDIEDLPLTVGSLCGASGEKTGGDVSVILAGTMTVGSVALTENGASGSVGLADFRHLSSPSAIKAGGPVGGDFGVLLRTPGCTVDAPDVSGQKYVSGTSLDGFTALGDVRFVGATTDTRQAAGTNPFDRQTDFSGLSDTSIVLLGQYDLTDALTLKLGSGRRFFGGSFCCVDYAAVFGSHLRLSSVLSFTGEGETEIADLAITARAKSGVWIACGGRKTTVRASVTCPLLPDSLYFAYPSICGGSAAATAKGGESGASLTVEGGDWENVYGGSVRLTASAADRKAEGEISLTVTGGRFHGLVAGNGQNSLTGNVTVTVTGGVFDCTLCGMAAASPSVGQSVAVTGDVSVKIEGGAFRGDLLAFEADGDVKFKGKYALSLLGGDLTRVGMIRGVEKNLYYAKKLCSDSLEIAASLKADEELSGKIEFENPIASYADPSVLYRDGWYYYSYSKDYNGKPALWITRAANLPDLSAATPLMVWSAAVSGEGKEITSLWAPQVYFLDGKWYLYCTCADSSDSEIRHPYVWEGKGADPYDGFTFKGMLANTDGEVYAYLSPRIIEYGGTRYLVCGGFFRKSDRVVGSLHRQSLFMGELESPTAFKAGTKMIQISTVTTSWEGQGSNVLIQEGPFPIYSPDGQLWLAYSANQTYTDAYCTGLLRFKGTASDKLTDASLWEKQKDPIHQKNTVAGIYSPGAMVFTTSPDGTEIWAVYHAKFRSGLGYSYRLLFTQPVRFENGVPALDPPQAADTVFTFPLNSRSLASRIGAFDSVVTVAEPEETETLPPETEETPGGQGGSSPLVPILVIAGAAALGAVIGGLILRSGKKKETNGEEKKG
ncbi:MAG: family 43 glycosylhydrolase [Clostridia bacterium]|nr:family 43 glycosylhydrolase [Clostridia bacterium]